MTEELHATVASKLHSKGQRYTPRRRKLVEILAGSASPLAIRDVLKGRRDLPQSSVYRNLATLEAAGVVRRVSTDDEFGHYELAEDLTEHHHHLICTNCGAVEDVTIPRRFEKTMEETMARLEVETGWSTVGHRLDLLGTCRGCG